MTPEKQRIAIAEACGWTDVCTEEGEDVYIESRTICPWSGLRGLKTGESRRSFIPRYTEDLNAMHEAEKVLTEWQQHAYIEQLNRQQNEIARQTKNWAKLNNFWRVHSTAAQRAEAFLRALGKWEADS